MGIPSRTTEEQIRISITANTNSPIASVSRMVSGSLKLLNKAMENTIAGTASATAAPASVARTIAPNIRMVCTVSRLAAI